ncbi:MAG: beta-ketoacyl synthase N-terminal-like domain-containing protein [Planctomycetota bacterium]
MNTREVVITGVGCLGPFGIGMADLATALQRGEALTKPIDRTAGYHRANSATEFAACGPLDLSPWLSPQAARRMSNLSQYAVAAARMALQHAGLGDVRGERTAISLATAFGPGAFTEQLARQILEKGGKAASPFLFTDCVANAAAGQVAIDLGARGANSTICQREAGPLLALIQGAEDVARARADICLAGAVDEMSSLSHAILDRFRALVRPAPHGELPRPFDRRRTGMLAGEGATIVVLEAADAARARGARVLARNGPSVRAFEPTEGRASFGRDAHGLAATLGERIGDALSSVDAVVSTASGARQADALEAGILRQALRHGPPVLVPKAVHGEYGGGTIAAALLALHGSEFARPPACSEPDPALGITPFGGHMKAQRVLCSALAAGGAAAWTMLEAAR